jgi:TRAP-type C4-dicarboxylate transport system permease small subunit
MEVNHHHHVHFMRYFLACVPLSISIHILGVLDLLMIVISAIIMIRSSDKASSEAIEEAISESGIKFSYLFTAFKYGFMIMLLLCYIPRGGFYLFFLHRGRRIKRLHWY